jgi:hypothetical protein
VIGAWDWWLMTSPNTEKLEHEIERLVREHMAAWELAASAAVRRAFASAQISRAKQSVDAKESTRPKKVKRAAPQRRRPEEVAKLGERLYEVLCVKPGEGMQVLSADVGATARELARPMALLKKTGRVRSVGQRQFTRYFPMTEGAPQTP